MTKAEFLEMMEQKLTGELDEHTVGKTLRYYSDYIASAMRTQGNGTANFSQTRPEWEAKEEEKGTESHRWNKWLFLLCLLAVLFLLFTILRVLLPILLPVLLVLFVISLFKKE